MPDVLDRLTVPVTCGAVGISTSKAVSQPKLPRPNPLDEEKQYNTDGKTQTGSQKRRKHRTDRFDHEAAETENKCLQDQIEITHFLYLFNF